ncbi:MAG: trypsin-like peptidase domain-containing protein, partial [Methyloceanibacter sp.]
MTHSDRSPAATTSPRRRIIAGRPVFVAVAALIATSVLGITFGNIVPYAAAETPQTIDTPYGRAPLSFADLVQKVSPAVVSINVKGDSKVADNDLQIPGMPDIPEDSPLYDFFKHFRQGQPKGGEAPAQPHPTLAQGSGFFISPDGFVVTNNHVVEDAEDISVTLENGDKFPATLVGADARTDVALIKVKADGKKFPFVDFSEKDPRVGDWVLAVGNPFGLGGTVTAGIISAHNRDIGSGPYDYLQIDAAVNRGNSGGPTFNLDGDVIGVNTAIFSPSGGNVGIAFAVPAKTVKEVVQQLKAGGTVSRGW